MRVSYISKLLYTERSRFNKINVVTANTFLIMAIITGGIYTDIFAVLVSILAVAIVYLKWCLGYWSRKNVPTPPVSFPFGNAANIFFQRATFGVDIMDIYLKMKPKGLKFCGYYFFARPILMPLDPELIKTIMAKDFIHFTDHVGYVNEEVDPLSGHLFALKGLKWKNLRAKLTPTFTSGKMKMMFQILVDCSDNLVTLMDEMVSRKEDIDIKDILGRFTTDIIGSCAFGIECNSLKNPNAEFRQNGKKVFEPDVKDSLKIFLSIVFPEVLDFFKIPLSNKDVSKFFMNAVKETVDYREKNNIIRKDFMHLLIQLKNNVKIKDEETVGHLKTASEVNGNTKGSEVGTTLSIEELAAQAFVFFIAGFETSSTTSTFCFYELVSNPDVQDKLREEINTVLKKHDDKITYNGIMEMSYMDKCVNETLRKYPSVPFLHRECTQSYKLPDSDIVLNKGSQVFIPTFGIHRDPEYYPNPEKFDPERFSPENKAKRHPYTWLPFGEGPRACIGLRFGVMQTKVALTVLLRNYKFSLNRKTEEPLVMDPKSIILAAKGGIWLNAEKIVE